MRRGWGLGLLMVALLLGAGVAVAVLRLSGKMIDIRVVDVVTASPTGVPPSVPPAAALTSTALPTLRPTVTQPATPVVVQTESLPATPVVVPPATQASSATPVEIGGTQGPSPAASPSGTPPTATPTLAPGTVVAYTIQPGDTLSAIALQFDTTVAAITARNQIADPSTILWGFKLQIVVGEKTPPTVQPGGGEPPGTPIAPSPAVAPTPTTSPTPAARRGGWVRQPTSRHRSENSLSGTLAQSEAKS